MDDLTNIFDPSIDSAGDDVDELDRELATAGQVLQKIAEAEGIDLDALPEEDVADLLTMLRGEGFGGSQEQITQEPQTKEASETMSEENETQEFEPTVADVAAELAKVAAAQGIDFNQVSREEYHQAFEALAEQMSSPSYFEKKAEMQEKLAEADTIGRHMAHSFLDELNRAGEEEDEKVAASGLDRTEAELGAKSTGFASPATDKSRGYGGNTPHTAAEKAKAKLRRAKSVVGGAARKADTAVARGGEKIVGAFTKKPMTMGKARAAGYGAMGLAALAGGAGAAKMRKKESADQLEAEAIEMARTFLLENGVDPDTGEKIAQDEQVDPVAQRALEILQEAGYEIE